MKSPFLLLLVSLLSTAIVSAQKAAPSTDDSLPKILLIGDSISGGYEKAVKSALAGKAVVTKNEGNAQWTETGLEKIDSYLGDTKWDIIHFNWGLWDIYGWRYYDQDRSPEAYAKRLDTLVTRIPPVFQSEKPPPKDCRQRNLG
jgi:hypothetical protein